MKLKDSHAIVKEEMNRVIRRMLDDYVEKTVQRVSKKAAQDLRRTSPKRTGFYAKGWKATIERKHTHYVNGTVWNPPDYKIAHLLEDGHGPTPNRPWHVEGKPHIAQVEQAAVAEVVRKLERKL